MSSMKTWAAAVCLSVMTLPAVAAGNDAWRAVLGSAGQWVGQVRYAGNPAKTVDLRVNTETTPDKATVIRYLTYAEAGQRAYAMSLMTWHPETNALIESYFRRGNGSLHQYKVDSVDFKDASHWKLVYSRNGQNNGQPAKLKLEWERQGSRMLSKELACQVQGTSCDYKLKRETRLELQQ
ncbi:hypothetical protein NFHSH190041_31210 [Shewanella sp. NFH-SH190041]|uniref:hypothetical protein n=1 Tax=Shewanella sp. NFH-SH190041 TaxID=2950245 RepID=UPI0021C4B8E2|nr:hypothetical protein [Shewanella sp. NFH-SH190041]BDM65669.1 hypothetical protein NFHSH190041_31210 [Shewanella sp. NFH-SH190041]